MRLAAAMAACALGCAHAQSTGGKAEPTSEARPPSISMSEVAAGQWRIVFRSPQATAQLRFARNPDHSRATRWQVERDFELHHEKGADVLRRKNHTVFQTVSVTVPARYVALPKEYAPFSPFSDGGTLIYSGQFHVCTGTAECPSDYRWGLTVTPLPGKHVVVEGIVHDAELTFVDSGNGTNIYVGETEPLASSHFVAVMDRGMRREAREALYRLLPPMMDFYATRLGRLPFKPMLFASIDPEPPKGSELSMQGGVLPGQIFFHLYGEKWAEAPTEEILERLAWSFAHEAGHLFQSVGPRGDAYPKDQSWIHEGGAEAFAASSVVELGGLSCELVEKRIERAVTECAVGLEALSGRSLNASAEAGAFSNYYACGLVIHLAIDAEIKRSSGGARDLFDVWAEFLSRARAGEPSDQNTFLRTASELGATNAASFARALATASQDDPLQFLRAGLNDSTRLCGSRRERGVSPG
jgi:hypothetical protein